MFGFILTTEKSLNTIHIHHMKVQKFRHEARQLSSNFNFDSFYISTPLGSQKKKKKREDWARFSFHGFEGDE